MDTDTLDDELALLNVQLELAHGMQCFSMSCVQSKYRVITQLELEIAKVRARMEME